MSRKKHIILIKSFTNLSFHFFRGGALQLRFQNKKPQEIFVEKGWLKMTKDEDGNGMYLYMYLYVFVYVFVYLGIWNRL